VWTDEGKFSEDAGRSLVKPLVGGRFVEETYTGKFLGQELEEHMWLGWDGRKKKLVSVTIDSTVDHFLMLEGAAENGRLVFFGEEPGENGKPQKMKYVIRFDGPTRRVTESFLLGKGERKLAEVVYTRR
jgi:hypothetical protein